jgi:DMSO/TMAO reductase YedYZ molybdopterin-dependent catalytic subunit
MEMHQVRYFLAVARLLHFTRAADECHVTQPSLTRAIKQLEDELGGDLFRRERPQATRHVCVEGWSMIGKWSGVPFRAFLERVGADLTAKYVGFECADGYYSSIDMAPALHPQTLLTFRISDEILAPKYGYPLKLRVATKLGFKNPKWITAMYVTNRFPGGFWEDRGYNWFAGL